jgi:hypothetical protein
LNEDRSTSQTLTISSNIEYDIIEDMKKTRENISLFELSKLKSQKNSLLKVLGATDKSSLPSSTIENKEKNTIAQNSSFNRQTDVVLIGDKSNSHSPPFLLTFENFNKNVDNCLVDSGASSNIILFLFLFKLMSNHKNKQYRLFN